MGHVADGINVDEETHAGDDEQHHGGKRVEQDSGLNGQISDRAV